MNLYPLTVCCHRLNISLFTLRQWCQRAGIDLEQQRNRTDPRQKWLTEAQLYQLAQDHGRLLDEEKPDAEPIPPHTYKLLVGQVAQVVQQAEQIRADHAKLQEQAQGITAQLDAIKQDQAGHIATVQQEQVRLHKLVEGLGEQWSHVTSFQGDVTELRGRFRTQREDIEKYQKQTSAALEELRRMQTGAATRLDTLGIHLEKITTSQRGQAAKLDTVAEASEHQRQQLETIQAAQEEAAARLDSLTAASQEQAKQLEQLTARIEELKGEAQRSHQATQEQLDQAQARMQEQLQQAEKALQAQFQATLTTLRREMLEGLERRAQGIEQEQARDVADINRRQEQQGQWVEMALAKAENAATKAQAATTTALGSQRRIDGTEQQLAELNKRLQAEQQARESQAERLTQQLANAITAAQIPGQAQQKPRQPRSRSKPQTPPEQ